MSYIKTISSHHSKEWFFNAENMPNQQLVHDTYNHFNIGPRKDVFDPLQFLNLFENQYQAFKFSVTKGEDFIMIFEKLLLSEEQKHIIYGFILKWFGGYPVNNLDDVFDKALKEIQHKFLSYELNSPEKKFCKADQEMNKKFMKMGIALTTAINNNINATEILNAMDPQNITGQYNNFDELFEDACKNNALGTFDRETLRLIERSKCNFEFNCWLQEKHSWQYGDKKSYENFLTKDFFIEFLKYGRETKKNAANELEKASWQKHFLNSTDMKLNLISSDLKDNILKYICEVCPLEIYSMLETEKLQNSCNVEFNTLNGIISQFERLGLIRDAAVGSTHTNFRLKAEAHDLFNKGGFVLQDDVFDFNLKKLALEIENLQKKIGPDYLDQTSKISTIISTLLTGLTMINQK